jgi:conjugal transfer mating pair stabilization protein TraG
MADDLTSLVYGDGSNAAPSSPPDPSVGSTLGAIAWPSNAMPTPNQFANVPGGGAQMNPSDRDALIKTVAGEAGGEPALGQAGVAHAILNRVNAGGYGQGVQGVVHAPVKPGSQYHEFSVWNAPGVAESSKTTHSLTPDNPLYAKIGDIVDKVYSGAIPDPTGGATHYYAPRSMKGGIAPPWAAQLAVQNSVKIGNTIFVGGSSGPGQAPNQVVGGYSDVGQAGT